MIAQAGISENFYKGGWVKIQCPFWVNFQCLLTIKQMEELSKTISEQSQRIEKLKNELNKSSKDTKKIKQYKAAVKKLASTNFFETGDGLLYFGKYKEALDYFNKLVKLNRKDAGAYLGRARAYGKLGNDQKALKDFNQSINLNPLNGDAYYYRSEFYINRKEYGRAMPDMSKAIDLSKDTRQKQGWLRLRGDMYLGLREYQKALIDYDECIELAKDYPDNDIVPLSASCNESRGDIFSHLGNYNQAIKEYDKAIMLAPEKPSLYFDRGLAYSKSGNPQRAIIDYDKVIEVDKTNNLKWKNATKELGIPYKSIPSQDIIYNTYILRAGEYYNLGDINRALDDYTNAIDYDPIKPDAYSLRGYIYLMKDDKDKGIEDICSVSKESGQMKG